MKNKNELVEFVKANSMDTNEFYRCCVQEALEGYQLDDRFNEITYEEAVAVAELVSTDNPRTVCFIRNGSIAIRVNLTFLKDYREGALNWSKDYPDHITSDEELEEDNKNIVSNIEVHIETTSYCHNGETIIIKHDLNAYSIFEALFLVEQSKQK